jgi:hypothetical protein
MPNQFRLMDGIVGQAMRHAQEDSGPGTDAA